MQAFNTWIREDNNTNKENDKNITGLIGRVEAYADVVGESMNKDETFLCFHTRLGVAPATDTFAGTGPN
jgi:hypothetical protein